ncbi:MAG: D-alanyl-D-alanine carboxypeptidase/D-alanyl-D-alanine-endopeptidase [Pseudomonadota bacterium]
MRQALAIIALLLALILDGEQSVGASDGSVDVAEHPPDTALAPASLDPGSTDTAEALLEISPLLDGNVRAMITHALTHPALRGARVGLYAASLDSGAMLLRKNPHLLLNPASNAKLVTSAAALALLGPEHRFATFYASDGEIVNGTLQGNLYVRGRGDPTISTERLLAVLHELKLLGITKIEGRVLVDDSFFDGVREAKGWEQEDSDRAYAAPVGALSLNYNTVTVIARPGPFVGSPAILTVDPPSDYIQLDAKVTTSDWNARLYMRSFERGGRNVVRLRGHVSSDGGPQRIYRRVSDPALHFASALVGMLNDAGISVQRHPGRAYTPDRARVLVTDRSPRLATVVAELNKWSNNFIAEMLIKTLGAEIAGTPGSFERGLAVARQFLETEVGWRHGSYVFNNGSGLNDVNRFSTEQIAQLLRYMHGHAEAGHEFVSSLGVAGRQGTIALRLRDTAADRRLRAKTGTLSHVSALSGYVVTASGEPLVFSILVNGYDGSTRPIWEVQDMIGEALAMYAGDLRDRMDATALHRSEP